jgi:hypothetical protein
VLVVALVLGVVGCLGGSSRRWFLVFPWRGLLGLVAWVGRRAGPWRFLALRWSLALVACVGPWWNPGESGDKTIPNTSSSHTTRMRSF